MKWEDTGRKVKTVKPGDIVVRSGLAMRVAIVGDKIPRQGKRLAGIVVHGNWESDRELGTFRKVGLCQITVREDDTFIAKEPT